jgi:hypothetical protein
VWKNQKVARLTSASVAVLSVGLLSCASATTQSGTPTAPPSNLTRFAALAGKSLSGTSADWIPIASPFKNPVKVSTTIAPPVETDGPGVDGATQTVAFFDFANEADASAFFNNPPVDAHLISPGILAFESLAGDTGIPNPSRGLDLRSCLWVGGPGQGAAGAGTPSGGHLLPSGQCSPGQGAAAGSPSSSIGAATILQRGDVVVLVEGGDATVIGGVASPSELSQNTALAHSALQLLQMVGLP